MARRVTAGVLVGMAVLFAGCGEAELRVAWEGAPTKPSGREFMVVAVAPNDSTPATGRIDDPSVTQDVFELKDEELLGYYVEVYGQRCDDRRCSTIDYRRPRCVAGVDVQAGTGVSATIRLLSPEGECEVSLD